MISLRIQKKTVHSPLLVLITQPDRQQEDKYDSNLFLHIQFYSFLLIDTPHGNIFSKHDFPPPWVILPQERNGARYLDPKFSIWMSTVPVLDDYLTSATTSDDARKRNQNLLDMGALFNTTCCHLYNYCSNNPLRYTDPDGRTVYSYKYGENRYVFSSGCTVFDDFARRGLPALTSEIGGMLANFIGGIIGSGIGEGCVKGIDKVFGFMEIDTGSSTISKINSAVGNISSIAGDLDKIKGLKGSLANTVANIATTAKVIGYFSTIIDVGSPLLNGKQVATDSFIDITLGKSLCSTSHENVSALYLYAKTRVDDFIKNGDIEINYSWDGGLNGYSYYRSVIDQIKDELLILKSALEE